MESFVRGFVRASLAWLGVGVLIGLSMALFPGAALVYRPAHVHANLLGFVSMMIFGVAYHVIPRFTGNPLHSRRLAAAHFWVANAGLGMLVGGWMLRVWAAGPGTALIGAGATTSAVGAYFFIYNLWRTTGAAPARQAQRGPVARPSAPTPAAAR